LRAAFYWMTLRRSALDVYLHFGAFFSHPEVELGKDVSIGPYTVIGRAIIGERTQIAGGVQIVSGRVFDSIRPGEVASSINGVYDELIATQPGAVRGFLSEAEFWDVGTVEDYWRTSHAFAGREADRSSSAGRSLRIDASARVTRSILWDDVVVEAGAVVEECIVTDGVHVGAGAHHRRAVLIRDDNAGLAAVPMEFEL